MVPLLALQVSFLKLYCCNYIVDGSDYFKQFSREGWRYMDDVRSWQSSEPADDYVAISVLMIAQQLSL